jgi:protein CpxP
MSAFYCRTAMPGPLTRTVAIAALMGATILAGPLNAARADTVGNAAIQLAQASPPQSEAAKGATETKVDTVEQRITTLHTALNITPDQDAKWNDVAQAMRENATAMDKLIADSKATPQQNMTAVEDLRMYQKFSEAHVAGLKNLIVAFDALYTTMPDVQRKNADVVFQNSGHRAAAAHS